MAYAKRREVLTATLAATASLVAGKLARGSESIPSQANSAHLPRRRELLDARWRFAKAQAPPMRPKSPSIVLKTGPASADFDDSSWRVVELPHDYIVQGNFDPHANANHGFLPLYPAWYRRHFNLAVSDRGNSVWIDFEGVYRDAHVYLNGRFLARHPGGYTPFRVDVAPFANYGGKNILAVYVDPREFEGWWYEGGGIYRHVWLNVADPVHVAPWGVYVISDVQHHSSGASAKLTIDTRITNASGVDQSCTTTSEVVNAAGQSVADVSSDVHIPAGAGAGIKQIVTLKHVDLWSLENRNLYTLRTNIRRKGQLIDVHEQGFGVRTIRFDADQGFFLNGRSVKIQGTCNHQDFPGVGIGATDSLWYWRVRKLKELGCNAIHCTKNMMAPALYDACDQLGMLVMDENRRLGDTYNPTTHVGDPYAHTQHVEEMVLRDRNHPSVIIWSVCNDEHLVQNSSYGAKVFHTLKQAILRHDATRPISCSMSAGGARGNGWDAQYHHLQGFARYSDVEGLDFDPQNYDKFHIAFPRQPMLAGEIGSNTSDRGIYTSRPAAGYIDAYHGNPESAWRPVAQRPYIAGGFVWTGFDFRGEPVPYKWPCINSHFGILDMCGFPKDNAMYYKAWWNKTPLVHIFPHWNFSGREGKRVDVWCYSNCDAVELRVNGKSLGRKKMPRFLHLHWAVPFHPGVIEALGYRNNVVIASHRIETAGSPAGIILTPDRRQLLANGQEITPIAVAVTDSEGRLVPTARNQVRFTVTGSGILVGVANGDPSCHEPNQGAYRSAFNGLCMLLVRAGRKPGKIRMTASASGLTSASAVLHVTAS